MLRSLLLLAAMSATSLSAATQTWNSGNCASCVISFTTTNWVDSFEVPLFDTNLGNLTSVQITLNGTLDGDIRIESLDAQPATITATLQATLSLTRPDLSLLVVVIPNFVSVDNVTAFDGNIDFLGTSGRTYFNQGGNASASHTSPPPAGDLALFQALGGGSIFLPVTASGSSSATGAGNLISSFRTAAGADVEVVYTYDDGVPEPATFVLIGAGLLGLAFMGRRK